jgi:hypothetical protein
VILPPIQQAAVRTGATDHRPVERSRVEKKVIVRENVNAGQSVNFGAAALSRTDCALDGSAGAACRPPVQRHGRGHRLLYRLIPKLQAHLIAIQGKVVDLDRVPETKSDRSLVEKMFDRFQAAIGELKSGIDDLRDGLEQTATRGEINGIVEDIFDQLNVESETSIGRVKCIACGRDIHKVAGALTDAEVARALGTPPNSMAFHSTVSPPIGMQFTSREGFDSAITETPRAVRPFKPMQVRPKLKGSAHPPA